MKEKTSVKSLAGQIDVLNPRDLHAYFTKISWPKKLYTEPILQGESYRNPNLTPNPCISDSEGVAIRKAESVIKNNVLAYYVLAEAKVEKKAS